MIEGVLGRADRIVPSGRPRTVLAAVAVVLVLGFATATGLLASWTMSTVDAEGSGAQAMAAALDLTPKLLNYDYRTIDADIARAKSVTTGDYWAQNGLADTLKPAVVAQEASTQTVVRAAGTADARPGHVVVLVFVNQTTTGKGLSAPRVDSRVARVTIDRVDGKWLLAGFEPL